MSRTASLTAAIIGSTILLGGCAGRPTHAPEEPASLYRWLPIADHFGGHERLRERAKLISTDVGYQETNRIAALYAQEGVAVSYRVASLATTSLPGYDYETMWYIRTESRSLLLLCGSFFHDSPVPVVLTCFLDEPTSKEFETRIQRAAPSQLEGLDMASTAPLIEVLSVFEHGRAREAVLYNVLTSPSGTGPGGWKPLAEVSPSAAEFHIAFDWLLQQLGWGPY